MSLPESQIRGLQAGKHILTTARRGGNTNMDQSETEGRRQAMTQRMGRSVNELAARDAVKSATTFTTTEDDRHLDVMRQEEFEEAGKILDDYSDRSAIASIVKDNPPRKEMRRVRQQVHQCLKEVINNLDYQPTKSELSHWHTHNLGAVNHYKNVRDVNNGIRQHPLATNNHQQKLLLATNTHQHKLNIISGLSIMDAHTFRCEMWKRTSHNHQDSFYVRHRTLSWGADTRNQKRSKS